MFIQAALIPSGFSAGLAAAVTAGASVVLLVPFFVMLAKIIKRSGGLSRLMSRSILPALLVILFAFGLSEATSRPYFCQICHAMKPSAASWRSSPHKGVSCLSCHREKGFGGITIRKLEDVRMVSAAIVGSEVRGLNKPIRDEICLGCHANVANVERVRNGIKIRHRDFAGRSMLCIDCHIDVSHGKPERSRAVIMEKCSACHNGKEASADCSTCHLKKFSKKTVPEKSSGIDHGDRWIERHGVKSQGTCGACHAPADCAKCHIEMPHPD